MNYRNRVDKELNCYNIPAVSRDFTTGLAIEADKEIAKLKEQLTAFGMFKGLEAYFKRQVI